MDWRITTALVSALGAAALPLALAKFKTRLDLSRAKHGSLAGHARLARRVASRIPFYAYDETQVFRSDRAPEEIAARRRTAFMRLSSLYRERYPQTLRVTAEASSAISDLQFTSAYRVPFQYSAYVRAHLPVGAFVETSSGVTVTDLDGNRFYDLT